MRLTDKEMEMLDIEDRPPSSEHPSTASTDHLLDVLRRLRDVARNNREWDAMTTQEYYCTKQALADADAILAKHKGETQ